VDPATTLEGAIPGAAAGILTGIIGPFVANLYSGASPGDLFGSALVGIVIGFLVGALLGIGLAVGGRRIRNDFRMESGFILWSCGMLIGTITIAVAANWRWMPLGAAVGMAGAILGRRLFARMEAESAQLCNVTPDRTYLREAMDEGGSRRPVHRGARFSEE
jgi:hypothetical protein